MINSFYKLVVRAHREFINGKTNPLRLSLHRFLLFLCDLCASVFQISSQESFSTHSRFDRRRQPAFPHGN